MSETVDETTAAADGEAQAPPAPPVASPPVATTPVADVVPGQRPGVETLPQVGAASTAERTLAQDVVYAVALGWSITTLYRAIDRPDGARPGARAGGTRTDAGYLPRDDELTAAEATQRHLVRVDVGTRRLAHRLDPAPTEALRALTEELRKVRAAHRPVTAIRTRVRELHVALLCGLAAADSRLGRSYALGAALVRLADRAGHRGRSTAADTRSSSGRAVAALHEELLALHDSVRDLATVLPDHAGQSVRESVARWIVYVQGERRKLKEHKSSDRDELLLLQRQVLLWKALLVGEKAAVDSLSPHEYLAVGVEALRRLKRQALLVLRTVVGPLPVLILVVGCALVGVALWQSATSTATAAVISTVAGTVAAAWRTNRSVLTDMLDDWRKTITGAAIDSAVANAITLLPPDASMTVKRTARKRVLIPDAARGEAGTSSPPHGVEGDPAR